MLQHEKNLGNLQAESAFLVDVIITALENMDSMAQRYQSYQKGKVSVLMCIKALRMFFENDQELPRSLFTKKNAGVFKRMAWELN